jgi:ribulose 1,5-bisphosphate synthetase/thiazole synthase
MLRSGSSVKRDTFEETLCTRISVGYDVIVVGGGASGLIAAVSAARLGARTLLIERQGCLGGTATTGYVAQFIGFYNNGYRVVGGIPYEFTRRIVAADGSPDFTNYLLAEASETPVPIVNFPFNPEVVKWVADELVEEAGVDLLLHSSVVGILGTSEQVEGVLVQDVEGRRAIGGRIVVDASGDGVVAHNAGVPELREASEADHTTQPQSLLFRLSNVDVARFRQIPREEKRAIALRGVQSGDLFWESLAFMSTPGGTDAICLMSRIKGLDALEPSQATVAEREGRRQVKTILSFLKRELPGFENAIIAGIAPRVGTRETRRFKGQYVLTEADVLGSTTFPDAIALGAGPLDVHDARGAGIRLTMPAGPFEIPLHCLIPDVTKGLIVTGRCISATRAANGGARHMATAMALGQAAGTAAFVVATEANTSLGIPIRRVQELLLGNGAIISVEQCRHVDS